MGTDLFKSCDLDQWGRVLENYWETVKSFDKDKLEERER